MCGGVFLTNFEVFRNVITSYSNYVLFARVYVCLLACEYAHLWDTSASDEEQSDPVGKSGEKAPTSRGFAPQFWCYVVVMKSQVKGLFTQAIFVVATRCNFSRAKVATSKSHVQTTCNFQCDLSPRYRWGFEHVWNLMQFCCDKNCIELPRQKSPV